MHYIMHHLSGDLSVDSVSKTLRISASHLKEVGHLPADQKRKLRERVTGTEEE